MMTKYSSEISFPHYNFGFPDRSVGKESACNAGDPGSIPGSGRSTGEGIGYPLQYSWGPCGSAGKESTCNVGDLGSIPGLGRFPAEGNRYPLQYFGLENSMDCIVHGATLTVWITTNCEKFFKRREYETT